MPLRLHASESERAAVDQLTLIVGRRRPEPFNFLSELLHGIIDDVLLDICDRGCSCAADQRPVPDSEDSAAQLTASAVYELPHHSRFWRVHAHGAGQRGECCRLPDGSLWLWDVQGAESPVFSQAGEGLVPAIFRRRAAASTYPPSRRRLMLFAPSQRRPPTRRPPPRHSRLSDRLRRPRPPAPRRAAIVLDDAARA